MEEEPELHIVTEIHKWTDIQHHCLFEDKKRFVRLSRSKSFNIVPNDFQVIHPGKLFPVNIGGLRIITQPLGKILQDSKIVFSQKQLVVRTFYLDLSKIINSILYQIKNVIFVPSWFMNNLFGCNVSNSIPVRYGQIGSPGTKNRLHIFFDYLKSGEIDNAFYLHFPRLLIPKMKECTYELFDFWFSAEWFICSDCMQILCNAMKKNVSLKMVRLYIRFERGLSEDEQKRNNHILYNFAFLNIFISDHPTLETIVIDYNINEPVSLILTNLVQMINQNPRIKKIYWLGKQSDSIRKGHFQDIFNPILDSFSMIPETDNYFEVKSLYLNFPLFSPTSGFNQDYDFFLIELAGKLLDLDTKLEKRKDNDIELNNYENLLKHQLDLVFNDHFEKEFFVSDIKKTRDFYVFLKNVGKRSSIRSFRLNGLQFKPLVVNEADKNKHNLYQTKLLIYFFKGLYENLEELKTERVNKLIKSDSQTFENKPYYEKFLMSYSFISYVDFSNCNIGDFVLSVKPGNSSFFHLSYPSASILQPLYEYFKGNGYLYSLKLNDCGLTPDMIKHLFLSIANNDHLRIIEVDNNFYSRSAAVAIAQCIFSRDFLGIKLGFKSYSPKIVHLLTNNDDVKGTEMFEHFEFSSRMIIVTNILSSLFRKSFTEKEMNTKSLQSFSFNNIFYEISDDDEEFLHLNKMRNIKYVFGLKHPSDENLKKVEDLRKVLQEYSEYIKDLVDCNERFSDSIMNILSNNFSNEQNIYYDLKIFEMRNTNLKFRYHFLKLYLDPNFFAFRNLNIINLSSDLNSFLNSQCIGQMYYYERFANKAEFTALRINWPHSCKEPSNTFEKASASSSVEPVSNDFLLFTKMIGSLIIHFQQNDLPGLNEELIHFDISLDDVIKEFESLDPNIKVIYTSSDPKIYIDLFKELKFLIDYFIIYNQKKEEIPYNSFTEAYIDQWQKKLYESERKNTFIQCSRVVDEIKIRIFNEFEYLNFFDEIDAGQPSQSNVGNEIEEDIDIEKFISGMLSVSENGSEPAELEERSKKQRTGGKKRKEKHLAYF